MTEKKVASDAGPGVLSALPVLIRKPALKVLLGLSNATIYRLMATGDLPRPVKLGARAVAWRGAEIMSWINTRQVAA